MDVRLAQRLGTAVRGCRLAKRLTQAEAAEALHISPEFYGRIERGTTMPSVETLSRLVTTLGLSFDVVAQSAKPAPKTIPIPHGTMVLVDRIQRLLPRLPDRALRLLLAVLAEVARGSR